MREMRFFLDVAPLAEYSWTGIANVTANLARYLLKAHPESTIFYDDRNVILPQFVGIAVDSAPGGYLRAFIQSGNAVSGSLNQALRGDFVSVGIFPNKKPFHRIFDVELVVMHDLSALLLPEMHSPEVAADHAAAHIRDVATSDLVCCVSHATREDVLQYLRAPADRVFVSQLGCAAPKSVRKPSHPRSAEPAYAVVLGTVEPRKNLGLIAEFIRCRPQLLQDIALMFVGRWGWGPRFEDLFGDLMRMDECRDRIFFTEYASEQSKWRLLQQARFAIYPSLFEGFGLPVVECMAIGCPVITSHSSSLVELGLDERLYFDPLSVADFARAFGVAHALTARPETRREISEELMRRAAKFTWDGFGSRITERIRQHVATAYPSAALAPPRPKPAAAPAQPPKTAGAAVLGRAAVPST